MWLLLLLFYSTFILSEDYPPLYTNRFPQKPPPVENLKVAFYGDSTLHLQAKVLFQRLIQKNVEMVVHAGDLVYEHQKANYFLDKVNEIFGTEFPYVTTIGDHDLNEFQVFRDGFTNRDSKTPDLICEGEWGVAHVCVYKKAFVMIGAGLALKKSEYYEFLKSQLRRFKYYSWKVCFWHRTANNLQPGGKTDGFDPVYYDICKDGGAMILTGHQHMYGRTLEMTNFKNISQNDFSDINPNHIQLRPGHSFVVVSGLAGATPRKWNQKHILKDHWASVVGTQNMMDHGALICEFHHLQASCEFEDNRGIVHDQFTIQTVNQHSKLLEFPKSPLKSPNVFKSKIKETSVWNAYNGRQHSKKIKKIAEYYKDYFSITDELQIARFQHSDHLPLSNWQKLPVKKLFESTYQTDIRLSLKHFELEMFYNPFLSLFLQICGSAKIPKNIQSSFISQKKNDVMIEIKIKYEVIAKKEQRMRKRNYEVSEQLPETFLDKVKKYLNPFPEMKQVHPEEEAYDSSFSFPPAEQKEIIDYNQLMTPYHRQDLYQLEEGQIIWRLSLLHVLEATSKSVWTSPNLMTLIKSDLQKALENGNEEVDVRFTFESDLFGQFLLEELTVNDGNEMRLKPQWVSNGFNFQQ